MDRGIHEDELAAGGAALAPAAMAVPAAAGRPEAGGDEPPTNCGEHLEISHRGIAGEMLTQERGAEVGIERILHFREHVRAERVGFGIRRPLPASVMDDGEIAFGFEAAQQAPEVPAGQVTAARAIADAERAVVHLMQHDQAIALFLAHDQHVLAPGNGVVHSIVNESRKRTFLL